MWLEMCTLVPLHSKLAGSITALAKESLVACTYHLVYCAVWTLRCVLTRVSSTSHPLMGSAGRAGT